MTTDFGLNIRYNYDIFFSKMWDESDLSTSLVTWGRQRDFNQDHFFPFLMEQCRSWINIRPNRRYTRKAVELGWGAGEGTTYRGQQRCERLRFMGIGMPTSRTGTETRGDVPGGIASDLDIWTHSTPI